MLIKSGELNSVLMLYNTDIDSLFNINLKNMKEKLLPVVSQPYIIPYICAACTSPSSTSQ